MKSSFYHIQLNVSFDNLSFYKELFALLGWSIIFEIETVIGFKSETSGDIWFVKNTTNKKQDYDLVGMNHLSVKVEEQENVDQVAAFLTSNNIDHLFETPRHRPEFSKEGATYYQIMFASPDKILFEIVYIGPKS